jgi:hypothetical protein
MARKAKAKRCGRPRLSKGEGRVVYSVGFPSSLVRRATIFAALTEAHFTETLEQALEEWVDSWERSCS